MRPPIKSDETFYDAEFPIAGIDLSASHDQQPTRPMPDGSQAQTTPVGINVRAFEPSTQRARGGQRPGLERYINQQVSGANKIQHLNYVVDPDASALAGESDFGGGDNVAGDGQATTDLRTGGLVRVGGTALAHTRRLAPKIIWANPADILQGTALSATQLNAIAQNPFSTATLSGVFTYTPPSGTVLPVGNGQKLSVRFVAADTLTYRPAVKNVKINVTASPIVFRQANRVGTGPIPASQALSFLSNVTAGNRLFAVLHVNNNNTPPDLTSTTASITDSQGNSWVKIGTVTLTGVWSVGNATEVTLWHAAAGATGADTVTANFNNPTSNSSWIRMHVLEFSGMAAAPLDVLATSNSASSAVPLVATTAATSVSGSGEALLAIFTVPLLTFGDNWELSGVPASMTPVFSLNTLFPDDILYRIGVGAGSYTVSDDEPNSGANAGYTTILASFKHA